MKRPFHEHDGNGRARPHPHAPAGRPPRGGPERWRTLSGVHVPELEGELRRLLAGGPRILHVGTDSKQRAYHTDYVTVVAVVQPGHGGRVFYKRERRPRSRSLAHKLFLETELSLTVASTLEVRGLRPIVVHVDANEDLKHLSSRYVQALSGMVVGYGFQVRVKPDSWCATHVADFVVNERHVRVA